MGRNHLEGSRGAQYVDSPMTSGVTIRSLCSDADYRQCVALQRLTWGNDYDEVVPPTVLRVAQKVGGVAAGAFEPGGQMIGFVFGMAGVRDGRVIHWSDMLAVRADARDRGIGKRLKEHQRIAAIAVGAATMYWTCDPLVARNAHLNFNRLGVRIDEYVEDMYGASSSDLHRGLGTDRFVVAWSLDRDPRTGPAATAAEGARGGADAPVMNPGGRALSTSELARRADAEALRVEIPLDIVGVRDTDPGAAARWRVSTRHAFQWALGRGFAVARFDADRGQGRGWYLMTRASGATER
jgi:chorismate synthase